MQYIYNPFKAGFIIIVPKCFVKPPLKAVTANIQAN